MKKVIRIIAISLSDTPIYSYPIIAGNNIYIKDAESLVLYQIK